MSGFEETQKEGAKEREREKKLLSFFFEEKGVTVRGVS